MDAAGETRRRVRERCASAVTLSLSLGYNEHVVERIAALQPLSEDHHHGLVLALKARRAAAGVPGYDPQTQWREIERRFADELEPHFRIEESVLAPLLRKHGETALVERLLAEHAQLRALVSRTHDRRASALDRFGETLERHIRFEERELFEIAQRVLRPDELTAVEQACRDRLRS